MNWRGRQRFPAMLRVAVCWSVLLGSIPCLASDLSIQPVREGWENASLKDVEAVLVSAAEPLWKAAGSPALPVIRVEATGGPMVLHRRDADGAIRVRLAAQGRHWSQLAYQFSHEFAHILCGFDPAHQSHLWLEEAACEAASLFALRHMAKSWSQDKDSTWASYAPHLKSYSDALIEESALKSPDNFRSWYGRHKERVQENPDDRKLLRVISLEWLRLLEEDPRGWRALRYLNQGDHLAGESLTDAFRRWRKHCPEKDRQQVDRIMRLLIDSGEITPGAADVDSREPAGS